MHARPLCFLLIAFVLAGCSHGGQPAAGPDVEARDNRYEPNSLTVSQNDRVTCENVGQNEHTVTIHKAGEPLTQTRKDTEISPGASTDYRFEETGTYHVYCRYHSAGTAGDFEDGMVLTITVQ
jgi:plastocyanin